MKDTIIKLNDILATMLVVILTFGFGIAGSASQGSLGFILGAIAGFFVGSLMSGVWFVLSGIHQQLIESNKQLKQIKDQAVHSSQQLSKLNQPYVSNPNQQA
jgi:hypothetical protein